MGFFNIAHPSIKSGFMKVPSVESSDTRALMGISTRHNCVPTKFKEAEQVTSL